MTSNTLKCLGKLSLSLLLAVSLNGAAFAGVAPVEGSACALQPHADAAVVMKLMGMVNNRTEKSLSGIAYTINDGIVIRQSYIKDGKIIIPSEGLYTVSRGSSFMPLDNSPVSINGKTWRTIAYTYNRDVVRNIKMKKGDLVLTDANKTRGWALTSVGGIAGAWSKSNEASATFQIRKVTGNYYGASFPVTVGKMTTPAAADGSLMKGSSAPEGNTFATSEGNLDRFLVSGNTFTTGRSFVVVDKIDDDGTVHVRELATDSTSNIWMSPNNPVVGTYANGAMFEIDGAKVSVKNITKNSAEVTIADKAGTVTKTLSFDAEDDKWFPMSQESFLDALVFSKGGDTAVHLNVVPGAPFKDGKVELVAYNDVTNLENGSDWITDNRFLARPDS